MFAYIKGTVTAVGVSKAKGETAPVEIWLEAGGVGYSIWTAPTTADKLREGREQTLYISQSSAMYGGETTLYGFASLQERALFELLRDLPGTGAKKALDYFEKITAKSSGRFLEAIARGDAKLLATFFGFSPKTSAKMLAELREKAGMMAGTPASSIVSRRSPEAGTAGAWLDGRLWGQVLAALVGLGFGSEDAESALRGAVDKWSEKAPQEAPSAEILLKMALRELTVAK